MDKDIKEYWERSTPMSFTKEGWSYQQKRKFRYQLQDYMHGVFGFQDWKGFKVLDLGCGSGIDSVEFAKNGALVTAVDITESAIQQTIQNSLEAKVSLTVFPPLNSQTLPFPDEDFDLVYSYGVLHHIPDVEVTLKEVQRVLKPGGRFMGMVYHRDSLLFAYSILLRGWKDNSLTRAWNDIQLASYYSERNEDCPYTRTYTKAEAWYLFSRYFRGMDSSVHYNVIDTLERRKVKFELDSREVTLGWHLIVKAVK